MAALFLTAFFLTAFFLAAFFLTAFFLTAFFLAAFFLTAPEPIIFPGLPHSLRFSPFISPTYSSSLMFPIIVLSVPTLPAIHFWLFLPVFPDLVCSPSLSPFSAVFFPFHLLALLTLPVTYYSYIVLPTLIFPALLTFLFPLSPSNHSSCPHSSPSGYPSSLLWLSLQPHICLTSLTTRSLSLTTRSPFIAVPYPFTVCRLFHVRSTSTSNRSFTTSSDINQFVHQRFLLVAHLAVTRLFLLGLTSPMCSYHSFGTIRRVGRLDAQLS